MTREGALLVMVGAAVVLLAVLAWAWWRRSRRDSALSAPYGELPADAAVLGTSDALYVATTRHGEPLERLAIRGLGFRSRVGVTISDAGVALDLTGQRRMVIARDRIRSVDQATVAIDRVVERDGLVRVTWSIDGTTLVDTYLRNQEGSARALAEAIDAIATPGGTTSGTTTGTDE